MVNYTPPTTARKFDNRPHAAACTNQGKMMTCCTPTTLLPRAAGRLTALGLALWLGSGGPAPAQTAQADALVSAHNRWRAEVGVAPLRWADDLAQSAQRWADTLARDNACRMRHGGAPGNAGENLYWASPVRWSDGRTEVQQIRPEQVVNAWGSEKLDYFADTNRCTPGKMCGHYTQMVWSSTRELGCAAQVCDNREQLWVCHYRPAGNYVGQKPF